MYKAHSYKPLKVNLNKPSTNWAKWRVIPLSKNNKGKKIFKNSNASTKVQHIQDKKKLENNQTLEVEILVEGLILLFSLAV